MYSPDGFASLACAMHNQCSFLSWQQPFIELMNLIHGNIYAFFALQALLWVVLVGAIYFLAKEMNSKHLFLTPFLILFGGTFFIHNFIGSLENDAFGIILLLIGFICYYKYKNTHNKLFILAAINFCVTSLAYWFWIGHLAKLPILISPIAEVMFWVNWASWLFLFYAIIFIIVLALKKKKYLELPLPFLVLFYPKIFIFIIPALIKVIDYFVEFISKKENANFIFTILVIGLMVGQTTSVAISTYNSWNREIVDENCVTVNDEYYLRATKGINYSYNQIDVGDLKICKQKNSG
jgi:hypothetical protein